MKKCGYCKQLKLAEEFSPCSRFKDGLRWECRSCGREMSKKWRAKDSDNDRRTKTLHRHKLTLEKYDEILKSQNGVCAICNKRESRKNTKHLAIDHDHSCCKIGRSCDECRRGLLCHNCNAAIGYACEDIEILYAMIKYLESWNKNV